MSTSAVFVWLAFVVPTANAQIVFPRFNELATTLGVTAPDVRCDTLDEWATDPLIPREGRKWLAYVRNSGTPQAYAVLGPDVCLGMLWLVYDPADLTTTTVNGMGPSWVGTIEGIAIFTFAHEAQHLRGIRDETDADCGALAALPGLLNELHVPARRAALFLDFARRRHITAPPAYQTHPC